MTCKCSSQRAVSVYGSQVLKVVWLKLSPAPSATVTDRYKHHACDVMTLYGFLLVTQQM